MTIEELITEINIKKQLKECIESKIEREKLQLTEVEKEINEYSSELLNLLKEQNLTTFEHNSLVAELFSKENIGYTNDSDVIKYLKDKGFLQYIKVKTTESIDKNALKKALKNCDWLANELNQFVNKTVTEYVVVTTKENHEKMLEHINEGKSK